MTKLALNYDYQLDFVGFIQAYVTFIVMYDTSANVLTTHFEMSHLKSRQ